TDDGVIVTCSCGRTSAGPLPRALTPVPQGANFACEFPRPRPAPLPLYRPPHPPPQARGARLERSCCSPSSPGEGGWEGTGEESRGGEGLGWGSYPDKTR